MGKGSDSSPLTILWIIVWLLLLIFVAFWVATFFAFFYIILYIFVPCVPALKDLCDILHRGVIFPYYCSDNIMNGRDLASGLNFIVSGGSSS